ncbi:MAG: replication protein RepA [Terriglobia bacterium]
MRRPPAGQLIHRRQNGKFFLEVVAHPRFGLPFGQDRLIPIWVATLAVKQKSRTVHFQRAAQLLEFLQLPKDGIHYRRLIQGFERIFAASIFFGTEEQRAGGQCFDWTRFHFFDRMVLWFNRAGPQDSGNVPHRGNIITLSEGFYEEINRHPIPVERQVVAGLANAPGLLDFYVWIVWKSWTIKSSPVRIPLFGPQGIQAQLGATSYSRDKRFRQTLRQWLERISPFWPQCPAELSHDGQFLTIYCSKRSPAIHQVSAR